LQISLFSKEAKKAHKTQDCPLAHAQQLQYPVLSLDVSVVSKSPGRRGPRPQGCKGSGVEANWLSAPHLSSTHLSVRQTCVQYDTDGANCQTDREEQKKLKIRKNMQEKPTINDQQYQEEIDTPTCWQ